MPYIGITGFTRRGEVEAVLSSFPADSNRQLMVGVLASWKSMRGLPMKDRWQKQTPDPKAISGIFLGDPRVLNLVHLSTQEGEERSLLRDMFKIHDLAGPNFHGFQLNVAWPSISDIEDWRIAVGYKYHLVLQVGAKAMAEAGHEGQVARRTSDYYGGLIDTVLIDPSGGTGQPFDPEQARLMLLAIGEELPDVQLAVAGGLGPDTLHLVETLVGYFPDLSIDAQSRVRDEEHNLDLDRAKRYVEGALALFTHKQHD